MKVKKIFFLALPLVVYMAFIFVVSTRPMPDFSPEIWEIDKVYHFMAYALMGFLLARAVRGNADLKGGQKSPAPWRVIALSFVIAFLFGLFLEVCQLFVPGRSAEALDAAANGAGGLLGAFIYERLRRLRIGAR